MNKISGTMYVVKLWWLLLTVLSVVVNTNKWTLLVFMRRSVSCSWHCGLQCHSPAPRNRDNTASSNSSWDRWRHSSPNLYILLQQSTCLGKFLTCHMVWCLTVITRAGMYHLQHYSQCILEFNLIHFSSVISLCIANHTLCLKKKRQWRSTL